MTVVDWLIVAFAGLLAVYGYRQGFIVGLLSLIGFLLGAFIGAGLWAVAFLILLTRHHQLASHGHGWYVWVGLSGFLLGLWGLSLMLLRRRSLARLQSR